MPPLAGRLRTRLFAVAGVLVLLGIRAALADPQGGAIQDTAVRALNATVESSGAVLRGKLARTGRVVVASSGALGGGMPPIGDWEKVRVPAATRNLARRTARMLAVAWITGGRGNVSTASTQLARTAGTISVTGVAAGGNAGTIQASSGVKPGLCGSRFDKAASGRTCRMVPYDPTVLIDHFTQDTSLDTTKWVIDGPAATAAFSNFNSPSSGALVAPSLNFSSVLGLGISGAAGGYQQTAIQSAQAFMPPFTLTAQFEVTSIGAGPVQLAITSLNGGAGLSLVGGVGANPVFTGFWYGAPSGAGSHWNEIGKLTNSPPQLNVPYTVVLSVDAAGMAILTLRSASGRIRQARVAVGAGPFYVALGAGSGAYLTGRPNQAYWGSLRITTTTTMPVVATESQPSPPPPNSPSSGSPIAVDPWPEITSVTPTGSASDPGIVIRGTGFGDAPPYNGDGYNLRFYDARGWDAGWYHRYGDPYSGDWVHVDVTQWTNNKIVVARFTGAYGTWVFLPGDEVTIFIWNAQNHTLGPARYTLIAGQSPPLAPPSTPPAPVETGHSHHQPVRCPGNLPLDANRKRCAEQKFLGKFREYLTQHGEIKMIPATIPKRTKIVEPQSPGSDSSPVPTIRTTQH